MSSLARHSVEDAVDLIWASTAQEVGEAEVAQALAALARRASDRMPELESDPALIRADDDQEWITALAARLEEAAPASAEFVSFFCRTHRGCGPSTEVTRIEWRYLD